jgi:hypothetical protein
MDLERTDDFPDARALQRAAVGTVYAYRRYLIFGPDPMYFVIAKLDDERWVRAQAAASFQAALAAMSRDAGDGATRVIDDCDSKTLARLLTRKEVKADGNEAHVGLFTATLSPDEWPKRPRPDRPDVAAIAAARKRAKTAEGERALAAELARLKPQAGATPKELAMLDEALGGAPKDLRQLLSWSNGHARLELMSIEQMIEVNRDLERENLFVLNDNDNGDYWGLVTDGPLAGALFYDDYDFHDPPSDAIKATSILDWLKSANGEGPGNAEDDP